MSMTPFEVKPAWWANMQFYVFDQVTAVRQSQIELLRDVYKIQGIRDNHPPLLRNFSAGQNRSHETYELGSWPQESWDNPNSATDLYNPPSVIFGTNSPYHSHSLACAAHLIAEGMGVMITLIDRNIGLENVFTDRQRAVALYHCNGDSANARRCLTYWSITGNHTDGKARLVEDTDWFLDVYPDDELMWYQIQNGSEMEDYDNIAAPWGLSATAQGVLNRLVAVGSTVTGTVTADGASTITLDTGDVTNMSLVANSIIYFGTLGVARRVSIADAGTDVVTYTGGNVTATVGEVISNGMGMTHVATTALQTAFDAFFDIIEDMVLASKTKSHVLRRSMHWYRLSGGDNKSGHTETGVCDEFMFSRRHSGTGIIGTRGGYLWDFFLELWRAGIRWFMYHSPFNSNHAEIFLRNDGSTMRYFEPRQAAAVIANGKQTHCTASGTGTNIPVDDSSDFLDTYRAVMGESGISSEIATIPDATHITLADSVTYSIDEAIYRTNTDDAVEWSLVNLDEPDVRRALIKIGYFLARKGDESIVTSNYFE